MNKLNYTELSRNLLYASFGEFGMAARGISSLIRSSRTTKEQNEILTAAAAYPAIVQHKDFIIS
jgi:hypothetical protein